MARRHREQASELRRYTKHAGGVHAPKRLEVVGIAELRQSTQPNHSTTVERIVIQRLPIQE
jgi:hypothetical protein